VTLSASLVVIAGEFQDWEPRQIGCRMCPGLRPAADNDWDYGNGTRVGMGVAVGSGCLRGRLRVGGFVVWKVFSSSLAVEMG
jgi:hypothetical protein